MTLNDTTSYILVISKLKKLKKSYAGIKTWFLVLCQTLGIRWTTLTQNSWVLWYNWCSIIICTSFKNTIIKGFNSFLAMFCLYLYHWKKLLCETKLLALLAPYAYFSRHFLSSLKRHWWCIQICSKSGTYYF